MSEKLFSLGLCWQRARVATLLPQFTFILASLPIWVNRKNLASMKASIGKRILDVLQMATQCFNRKTVSVEVVFYYPHFGKWRHGSGGRVLMRTMWLVRYSIGTVEIFFQRGCVEIEAGRLVGQEFGCLNRLGL